MRKLGITIAALAAVLFGLVGFAPSPASAAGHEGSLCPAIQGFADQVADNPNPIDGNNEPVLSASQGAADACVESALDPLICGVHKGVSARPGSPLSDVTGAIAENFTCAADDEGDKTTQTTVPGGNNGGGGGTDDEVLANNAAADGGLPRTGGELFAGAGLGLAALAGLVRRFIR